MIRRSSDHFGIDPSGFNPLVMYDGLFVSRFAASWARGGLGGWDAFINHLVYFGYHLPTLTVILASRLGRWLGCVDVFIR